MSNLIDPKDRPPAEVIAAAELVGRWFGERNVKDWKLGLCQARNDSVTLHVPTGYRLVPLEPTKAMLDAGFKCWMRMDLSDETYHAMLAAAPII